MGIAGAAYGASKSLEDIVAERMLAQRLEAEIADRQSRFQLDEQRLGESKRASLVDEGQRQQTIDAGERTRRDRNNASGLDLMKADKGEMDMDAAITGLPAHLKGMGGAMRAGLVGKLSPDDLQSPEDRTAALNADEQRQIRIRRASQAPTQAPEKKPMVVTMPDGSIQDMNNVLPPGAVPYDPVAARSSKPQNDREAIDTANEAKRLASALVSHKGFGGVFGLAGSYMPTVKQSTADAEQLLGSLQSMLTMENMGKMKGVLSDSDMKVLRQASTTLSNRMGDEAARAELNRIVEVMGKVGGGMESPSAPSAVDPRVQALIQKYGKPQQ